MSPSSTNLDSSEAGMGKDHPKYHHLVKSIATSLRNRCGVNKGVRIVLAVSGGCDSVALSRAMAILADSRRWQLKPAIGHVQHHLREQAAENDARFVERLAGELNMPFMRTDIEIPMDKQPDGNASKSLKSGNLEGTARKLRYQALAVMARSFGARFIATAHHADDQLETLLMHMLRGSSVTGLRGIAWRRFLEPEHSSTKARMILTRPMLGLTRHDATDFLNSLQQSWQEDRMNVDTSFLRVRLRREVLPLLCDIRPDLPKKSVDLADHFRQVHHLLAAEVSRYHERVSRHENEYAIDRGEARLMPKPILIMLLRRLCSDLGAKVDRLGLNALKPVVRAIQDTEGGHRRFDLTCGLVLIITRVDVMIKKQSA